jgi:hypothetical protein
VASIDTTHDHVICTHPAALQHPPLSITHIPHARRNPGSISPLFLAFTTTRQPLSAPTDEEGEGGVGGRGRAVEEGEGGVSSGHVSSSSSSDNSPPERTPCTAAPPAGMWQTCSSTPEQSRPGRLPETRPRRLDPTRTCAQDTVSFARTSTQQTTTHTWQKAGAGRVQAC